jgi:hypothetical protein
MQTRVLPLAITVAFCLGTLSAPAGFSMGTSQDQGDWSPKGQSESTCTATAFCWDGSTRSCSGSTLCKSVDSNCSYQRGYVECDSKRFYCPSCPTCSMENYSCDYHEDCQPYGEPLCLSCYCSEERDPRDPAGLPIGFCICP